MSRRNNHPYRCSFFDGRGQCTAIGGGNPPLCYRHTGFDDLDEEDLFERVLEHPRFVNIAHKIGEYFDRAVEKALDKNERTSTFCEWPPRAPEPEPRRRGARAGKQRRSPPTPPPKEEKSRALTARDVLGIRQDVKLTVELIEKKRRLLARIHHPDQGGSEEMMKRINQAVDQLRQEVR